MDLKNIGYMPDKFYIKFNEDNLDNLIKLDENNKFSEELSVFIHEYYHYLNNVTTFQGLRSFNYNFIDKVKLITRLQCFGGGLKAFPVNENSDPNCQDEIKYWYDTNKLDSGDSNVVKIAEEINNTQTRRVRLINIRPVEEVLDCIVGGQVISGPRTHVQLEVEGIKADKFNLNLAALDEFLSASIDELLYENDVTDNMEILQNRHFYPYRFFDELLRFKGLEREEPKFKLLIVYKAMHTDNPTVKLIEIIDRVAENPEEFYNSPIEYLEKNFPINEIQWIDKSLQYLYDSSQEFGSLKHKRYNLSNVLNIIYNTVSQAKCKLMGDPYYFVRVFIENDLKTIEGRKRVLEFIKENLKVFNCFLQLKEGKLIDPFKCKYEPHIKLILAIHEILSGVENERYLSRNTDRYKYQLDENPEDYKIENFHEPPFTSIWQIAMNELSFMGLYLEDKKKGTTEVDQGSCVGENG